MVRGRAPVQGLLRPDRRGSVTKGMDMARTERPGLTSLSAALLVGGPLLMAVGRLLLVPLNDQGWDAALTDAAAHQTRSDVGWLLAMAGAGLIAASALALVQLLGRAGGTRPAAFALVTTAVGWAGCAGICAAGMLLSYQGKAPDRAVQVQLLKDLNAGHTTYIFLMCVLAAVGYLVLAVGLARRQVLSKGVAAVVGLGAVGTLLSMPGPAKPVLVGVALLLAVGQALVVRAVGLERPASAPAPAWEPVTA